MAEQEPEAIAELATISDRKLSNVSRTLKALARNGIVETRRSRHSKRSITKTTEYDIQLSACY